MSSSCTLARGAESEYQLLSYGFVVPGNALQGPDERFQCAEGGLWIGADRGVKWGSEMELLDDVVLVCSEGGRIISDARRRTSRDTECEYIGCPS